MCFPTKMFNRGHTTVSIMDGIKPSLGIWNVTFISIWVNYYKIVVKLLLFYDAWMCKGIITCTVL